MFKNLLSIKLFIFIISISFCLTNSVQSQDLILYLNKDGALTETPFPPFNPGTTGGELENVYDSVTWKYELKQNTTGTFYTINILVGCFSPYGCKMQAQFLLSHSGTETVLATSDTISAPLSGFTAIGYRYPSRSYKQYSGLDPTAVAGDQFIFRVKKISGLMGFVYLREADKGTSSIKLSQSLSAPLSPSLISPSDYATDQLTSLTLSWSPSANTSTYHLQVSKNSTFSNIIFDDSILTTTSKQIGPLENNIKYYWRVNAKNSAGSSPWSTIRNFTTIMGVPSSPELVSPSNSAIDQPVNLTLSWNPSENASTYRLQVSTNSDFSYIVFDDSTLTTTSKQIGSLENNIKYYWRVNAKNYYGTSPWSVVWSFITNISASVPINPNGGFEEATLGEKRGRDIPGWELSLNAGALATFEVVYDPVIEGNRALILETKVLGEKVYYIQAINAPFTVEPGTKYTYSVWVKADKEGPIVDFTVGDPLYNEWGRAHQVVITTKWQLVTFQFTAPANASAGRAPILFSESANSTYLPITYYIDDLRIVKSGQSVGIEEENQIPTEYMLSQNYPNPFNPNTRIQYFIPADVFVTLKIYDLYGREVETLINKQQEAGMYSITWQANSNPGGLSSGVYYYRLHAGKYSDVKKMLYLR
jgi:hypothetical protein